MTLQPLTATCTPRKDVLDGQFGSVDFAAKLEQVVSDPDSYEDYGQPDRFFALTHPTGGMKRLMTGVFGRLSGQAVSDHREPSLAIIENRHGCRGLLAGIHHS